VVSFNHFQAVSAMEPLIIVDLQKAFPPPKKFVDRVRRYSRRFKRRIFTRFVNPKGSLFRTRLKQRSCLPGTADLDLLIEPEKGDIVLSKQGYGLAFARRRLAPAAPLARTGAFARGGRAALATAGRALLLSSAFLLVDGAPRTFLGFAFAHAAFAIAFLDVAGLAFLFGRIAAFISLRHEKRGLRYTLLNVAGSSAKRRGGSALPGVQ
jgi:hypothetical protein